MADIQHKRGTRAALDALAAGAALKPGQLHLLTDEARIAIALTASSFETFAKENEAGGGGGVEPWTRLFLGSDFTNAATGFVTITDGSSPFSWTPPANENFTIEAELLLLTTTGSNLPRVGVSIGAGQAFGAVEIIQVGALASSMTFLAGTFTSVAASIQVGAGSLPTANTPYLSRLLIKGRSGASPGAIALQMAAEIAGASICFVKAGSEMRMRAA